MALVAALLVMLAVSLIATVLLLSVQSNTKLSALEVRETQALRIAEAGVAEAVARLRRGDIVDDGDPHRVTQILLTAAGELPAVGSDSIPMATGQQEGAWLTYSVGTPGADALTIEYKTDPSRTRIDRYDANQTPPVQSKTGSAIYRITSTGRKGEARRRIVAEVTQRAFDLKLLGALVAGAGVRLAGSTSICGFDHRVDTPAHAGEGGPSGPGGCNENPALQQWQTGHEDLPGIWSARGIERGAEARAFGAPEQLANQAPFYPGPWDVLGLTEDAFYDWVGPGRWSELAAPRGLVHLDDNATRQDRSGSFSYHGGDGAGFLYVDGDLALSGSFAFRGLIYVEGDLKVNGDAWVLGAMVVRGGIYQRPGGRLTVLQSRDVVGQCAPRGRGSMVFLSWRELTK